MFRRPLRGACVILLVLVSAPACWAVEITLELVALDGHPDPHDITVPLGSTVQLAYQVSDAENLAFFEDKFSITGPASMLSLAALPTWWESQENVLPNTFAYKPVISQYHLVGQTGMSSAPFSHSTTGPSSLAVLEFSCVGVGDVVVTGLLDPAFAAADPITGLDLGELAISGLSNGVVIIHQQVEGIEFLLTYDVNDPAMGVIIGSPEPGVWPAGTEVDLLAASTDPLLYGFTGWEALVGTVPGGDASSPALHFTLDRDVSLRANFVPIPEPLSLGLLAVGLAGLRWRARGRGAASAPGVPARQAAQQGRRVAGEP